MSWFNMMLGAAFVSSSDPNFPADQVGTSFTVNYDKQIFGSQFDQSYPLDAAFDGNLTTFPDTSNANPVMGQQLDPPRRLTQIRYVPRQTVGSRMIGGKFQGTTSADPVSGTYVDLYTITTAPPDGVYTTVNIADTTAYKWVRYLSPTGGYANVAEIDFVTQTPGVARNIGKKITNTTIIGTTGSGYPPANSFDGLPSTFSDGVPGSYIGMEFNETQIVRYLRIYPRISAPERTIGLTLQGAASQAGPWTTLHTINYQMQANTYNVVEVSNQTTPYKCYRVINLNTYLSIAELEFYI